MGPSRPGFDKAHLRSFQVLVEARDEGPAPAEEPAEAAEEEHEEPAPAEPNEIQHFLDDHNLGLVNFSFTRTDLRRIGETTEIAQIHRIAEGMKATCKNPAHGACVCWVTRGRGGADALMFDLVKWATSGMTMSADEHTEAGRLVKISHGMKPRRPR